MKIKSFIACIGMAIALSGCKSDKLLLPYFTDLPKDESPVPVGDYTLKIVPSDELLINVSAADPAAVEDYSIPYQHPRVRDFNAPATMTQESLTLQRRKQNLTYQTYIVDKAGFINFPVLGKIHVEGMTLSGLEEYITEKVSETVVDPIVTVELVNFHVNVTGEVRNPGLQLVNQERYSVLDAITAAGDLNVFGIRNNVLLIREVDGRREFHRLNLNSKDIFESPYFYLKQNDVIYVEPNDIREANARTDQERQFKLSMVSVVVSAASVIASLAIALLMK